MAHVVVVVPCYNEETRLDRDAFRSFVLADHRLEFVFVNDGSTDRTIDVLKGLVAERPNGTFLLDLAQNRGKAEAVRAGIAFALERSPDCIGFWDADLAAPLTELNRFVTVLEERPVIEMVFGSRVKLLGRSIERRPARHYLGRVFATTVSLVLDLAIYDTQCGAKLFRATTALRQAVVQPFIARWIFDVELIARYKTLFAERSLADVIYEIPLDNWHDVTGSKLKATDFLRAMVDLWRISKRLHSRSNG